DDVVLVDRVHERIELKRHHFPALHRRAQRRFAAVQPDTSVCCNCNRQRKEKRFHNLEGPVSSIFFASTACRTAGSQSARVSASQPYDTCPYEVTPAPGRRTSSVTFSTKSRSSMSRAAVK